MCGFLGVISKDTINKNYIQASNVSTICRGPDSKKEIFSSTQKYNNYDNTYNLHLIFNRLAIIDLSKNAEQPMYSEKYNTILMFNGEIFNHVELRIELESKGINFTSNHSDSEVVLLGLSHFGTNFISKLIGQFSIVFINLNEMKVTLIRDRTGQKPLFYSINNGTLNFGSNLKSVASSLNQTSLNHDSLNEYLSLGVVPSPNTIFNGIYKVKPSEIISLDLKSENIVFTTTQYWNIDNFIDNKTFDEDDFYNILDDAVKIRTNADVGIANFLSGGIDSSSIVKIQSKNNVNTNTFSVSYFENKYDESKWFEAVADTYKTNHTTKQINGFFSNQDILSSIEIFDEPYSDPSTVPSYILSREIAKQYKVAISGDGGDELLGGYTRTMDSLSQPGVLQNLYSELFRLYPSFLGSGTDIKKYSRKLEDSYPAYFEDLKLLKLLGINYKKNTKNYFPKNTSDRYKMMQIYEYKLYLYELMMLKIDRTSMANSVEVRSPFVDHRLIEYVIQHDSDYIQKGKPKELLKSILRNDFDDQFLDRKKMGFVFDLEDWVFNNLDFIKEKINGGMIVSNLNPKIIDHLTFFKSRMNANRIWKLFFIEEYLNEV
jgi:asparagine synthase (glutamine-hydrolysing)